MNSTVKTKSILFACITALLTVLVFTPLDPTIAVLAAIAQIGIYAAVLATGFSPFYLLTPAVSYGIAYGLSLDPLLALLSLVYVPVAVVIGVCFRKKSSRSTTVVLSSVTIGVIGLVCLLVWALSQGVKFSIDGASELLKNVSNAVSIYMTEGVPDVMFEKNISKEAYRITLYELFYYFSISIAVFICNSVAFISTAVTKRVAPFIANKEKSITSFARKWKFVLSKQSAVMYLICYLCLMVGGETLTIPQQIAFNTVFSAIQGGVLIMAFRSLRERVSSGSAFVLILYIVLFFFFGLPILLIPLSVSGLFAVFKPKTKGGK